MSQSIINQINITRNFKLSEFQNPTDELVKVHPSLIYKLQALRDILACPIRITSGYRSPAHNKEVGGVPNSLHLEGRAADILVVDLYPETVKTAIATIGFKEVKYYTEKGHFHLGV